jgi:hypothetical protein
MPDLRFTPEEFERACSLLPEGTMWGDHLSVEIVLHVDQASRRAALSEAGITAVIHSQYPVTTDFDRGYAKARADAAKAIRALLEGDTK